MRISPLRDEFIGVVEGLRIDGAITDAVVEQLTDGLDRYSVIVIPSTPLTQATFVEFGRCFGELEHFVLAYGRTNAEPTVQIANLDENNRILVADDPRRVSIAADALWHTDSSYQPMRARYSMLLARRLPQVGGETHFCDTRGAYDALPKSMKEKLEDLIALHSIIHSRALVGFTEWTDAQRAKLRPIPQPLVIKNPRTQRRSLYLASHIFEIRGWPKAETLELLQYLTDHATQPRFVHAHKWSVDDVVIWDNRATMHRRAPYDDLHEVRELISLRVLEASDLYTQARV